MCYTRGVESKPREQGPSSRLELVRKAEGLLGGAESRIEGSEVHSVEAILRAAIETEPDVAKLRRFSLLLSEFERWNPSADEDPIHIDETTYEVRLTLLPTRRGGKPLVPSQVVQKLKDAGIVYGVHEAAVAAACVCANRSETVHRLLVAAGEAGQPGEDGSVSFAVKAFDKRLLMNPEEPFFGDLSVLVEDVKAGALLARVTPATQGRPGRDIRGRLLPATQGQPLSFTVGEGLQIAGEGGRELHALARGSLVVGEESLDLVPFHVVDGHLGVGQDIAFEGNVLVTGHVTGPVRITARDVFVAGNVEAVQISALGDVWVGGTIQGKAAIEAEGKVLARSISDSAIRAIGDVLVSDSIIESRVTSSGRVQTRLSSGFIEGGEVSGFRGVATHVLGSSYGLNTKVKVAVEDLRAPLLAALDKRIRENDESLSKIDDVKLRLAESGRTARQLGPDQQMVYITILRKEIQALEELRALRRRRRKVDSGQASGLQPTITVTGGLHPPVMVEIGETSEIIQEPLSGVVLGVGPDRKIAARKEEAKLKRH